MKDGTKFIVIFGSLIVGVLLFVSILLDLE